MNLEQRIGITGGTGLVGKALRKKLSSPLALVMRHPSVDIKSNEIVILGNFADPVTIEKFVSKINVLIHAATGVGPRSNFEEQFIRDDLVGTINLAKAFFKKNPDGHFIYLSTSGGLYDLEDQNIKTEDSEVHPKNIYGAIKLMVEGALENLPGKVSVLRPAALYGDSFKKNQTVGLIDKLLKSTVSNDVVPIFDKIESARDYLHVNDLVEAITLLINRKNGSAFEVYNIGTGEETSIGSVIGLVALISPEKVKVEILPTPNERTSLIVNSDKIFRDLGWKAQTSLKDGVMQMYQSFKKGS
jgi:nucleoside-diphosphate-sugar epimerase